MRCFQEQAHGVLYYSTVPLVSTSSQLAIVIQIEM